MTALLITAVSVDLRSRCSTIIRRRVATAPQRVRVSAGLAKWTRRGAGS
jgi:hypothetical protein